MHILSFILSRPCNREHCYNIIFNSWLKRVLVGQLPRGPIRQEDLYLSIGWISE
ncbi:unnamed protein product [Brassica oleracea var. botrytis]